MKRDRLVIKILLMVWIVVWVIFLVRPYIKKDLLGEYSALIALPLEEKRAFIMGAELYDFLRFCNDSIRPPSSYSIIGLEREDPLTYRRAVYYLYPNIDSPSAEFLFIYKRDGFSKEGYRPFKAMSDDKYILKREEG